jgi:hydroxymethylbilane synthase
LVVIGSRGSKLALWQANRVREKLADAGLEARVEIIHTTGDKITDVPLARLGAETSIKGLFTKEIEEALLDGRIDLAVHSMKDMPTELPEGLRIAAVPEREEARDALVGATLDSLKPGARVGTSALRRQAQLAAARPDLRIAPVRGNVDTRLRKLEAGEFDAILLAAAGLRRLGWQDRIAELIAVDVICPAVGQGALAVETREGDGRFDFLDHPEAHAAVDLERAFLRAMGGGCQVPMGCHVSGGLLRCAVAEPDGSRLRRFSGGGDGVLARALEAVR